MYSLSTYSSCTSQYAVHPSKHSYLRSSLAIYKCQIQQPWLVQPRKVSCRQPTSFDRLFCRVPLESGRHQTLWIPVNVQEYWQHQGFSHCSTVISSIKVLFNQRSMWRMHPEGQFSAS